jgi:SAM-dependent methyltransferase
VRCLFRRALAVLTFAALPVFCAESVAADPPDYEALRVAPVAVTPSRIVDEMLKLTDVGPGDFVVDLGSGDGRLVIAAVRQFGASGGFGVDISEGAVAFANAKAVEAGVADRVRFLLGDLFSTDIRRATVVTLYLFPAAMPRLRTKLLAELEPGTRVVSHDFPLPDWPVDRVARFAAPDKNDSVGRGDAVLYLYTVPARPQGS